MTRLLVSVRSAREAQAALRGGAALIDVKEPARGALGRARDDTIAEVVRTVAGARPVSAALGEFVDTFAAAPPTCETSLTYLKWGLHRCRDWKEGSWQSELSRAIHRLESRQPHPRLVAVAYADWQRARAPTPQDVCSFAETHAAGAFLIDTWEKDGATLLDWLSLADIERLCERCRAAGVPIALAGSLGPETIRVLLPLRPDWFAVRGAACRGRRRDAALDEDKVRQLAALLDANGA